MNVIQPTRRKFISGLISIIAAPAVIRTIDLMPTKIIAPTVEEVVAVRSGADLKSIREILLPGLRDVLTRDGWEFTWPSSYTAIYGAERVWK